MITNQEADELIQAVSHGHQDALHTLYTEYNQAVFLLALTLTKNRHWAEDIMQDTFVTVYDKAPTYSPNGKAHAWILAIARNLSRQRLQKEQKYALQDALDPQAPDPTPRFEDIIEQNAQIKDLLSVLSNTEQDIVLLHVLADIKLKDIAVYLRIPLGTVYWSYSNARRKMKRHLLRQPAHSRSLYR